MMFQYGGYAGSNIWQILIDWGFVDALLPFLLIFVIIFAILQKIAIFKDNNDKPDRKINGILSLVVAAMVVVPHVARIYPPAIDPIIMINLFLPQTAVILLAVLCVILLLGLAGGTIPNALLWVIALVALGFLVFIILMATIPGFFPTFGFLRDPSVQALLIILLVAGLVGYLLIREPGGGKFKDWVKDWLGPTT